MQAKITEVTKIWLSNKDTEVYLGVGPDFLKKLRLSGRLSYYKIGKTVFYRKSVIDRLIENGKIY